MAIFDIAGTTINDFHLGHRTLQKVLGTYGIQIGLGEVFLHEGKEGLTTVNDILGRHQTSGTLCAECIHKDFSDTLAIDYERIVPCAFSSVVDVFKILRANGVHIVLTTGNQRQAALKLIRKLGWSLSGDFDLLVTPEDLGGHLPDPISFAMERLQVEVPKEVVRIGGSTRAIAGGIRAGCGLSVGVTTGTHTQAQLRLAGPDHILDDMSGLIRLILPR